MKLETPLDTLKAYTQAIKKKDTAAMKTLLSQGTIKMAQDEAKAQNVSADEIISRETLFSTEQKALEYRNEKIEGEKATIEVRNSFGGFDIVPFIKENGVWKIAKEKYAEEMMKQAEEENRRMDEEMRNSRDEEPLIPPTPSTDANRFDQPTTVQQQLETATNKSRPFNDSTNQDKNNTNINIQNTNKSE